MTSPFDLRDLEALVAVADSGSFTAAAQLLLLSQPTVSARIATLETAFDTRLFDRGPGKVRPTPAGDVLVPRARAILHERDQAIQAVAAFLGRLTGSLRIGASSIPGSYLIPGVLAELRRTHPELRVSLSVEDTARTLEALRQADVEVGVVGRSAGEAGLEEVEVGEDEIVLVAAPDLANRFRGGASNNAQQLGEVPLVLREPGSGTRSAALSALEQAGLDVSALNIALEAGGNAAARAAALGGIGAAFLSRLCVTEELNSGRLMTIEVFAEPLRRPFVLVTRGGRTLSPAAQAFVQLLEAGVSRREAPRRKAPQ